MKNLIAVKTKTKKIRTAEFSQTLTISYFQTITGGDMEQMQQRGYTIEQYGSFQALSTRIHELTLRNRAYHKDLINLMYTLNVKKIPYELETEG